MFVGRRLLHISDIHCGPPYRPEVADAMIEAAQELAPDVIVASGDFTQRAKREQFAEARRLLDRLPKAPLVVTPGNHDVPLYRVIERIREPYRNYRESISNELQSVLRLEGMVIVSMNTTHPLRAITNGRLRLKQLQFCERALKEAPEDAFRIVVVHHHFMPAPDYERDQVMPKAKRALDWLIGQRVDMIMGGHLHRAYIANSLDVYSGADPNHGIIILQCGTTTSRRGRGREREKNTFNLVEVEGDIINVTHYMHFTDDGGFAPISRHSFPRPGKRMAAAEAALRDGREA
ncbi:MAG: metallophosphoesterase, partial [Planctomycetota bacterium]|nr:metallophosphoesterase [Planctomycetota bacterium]